MLRSHEVLRIPDIYKKDTGIRLEVNWNPEDKETNECKIVKISFGDKDFYVKREHLHALMFAIGNPGEQRNLIPQTLTQVKWYETVLSVKATKDIRKGENITFPIKISLPKTEEVVGGVRKKSFKERLLGV